MVRVHHHVYVQALRHRQRQLQAATKAVLACKQRYAWQGWCSYVRARAWEMHQRNIGTRHVLFVQLAKVMLAWKVSQPSPKNSPHMPCMSGSGKQYEADLEYDRRTKASSSRAAPRWHL